jgi:hypothetical protein
MKVKTEKWDVYWYDTEEWVSLTLTDPIVYSQMLVKAGIDFILVPEMDDLEDVIPGDIIDMIIEMGVTIFPTPAEPDSETEYEWEIRGSKKDGQELIVTS